MHTSSCIVEREVAGLHVHDFKLIHMRHRLSFESNFATTLEHEYARQGDLLLVLLRRAQLGGETPTNKQRSPRSAKTLRCLLSSIITCRAGTSEASPPSNLKLDLVRGPTRSNASMPMFKRVVWLEQCIQGPA